MKNIMFSVPLFVYKISQWESKKKQLKDLYNRSILIGGDNYPYVNTDFHKQQTKDFQYNHEIENILKDEIQLFKSESELNRYKVSDSWFELALEHQFHPVHAHGPIGYSSVCFIEFDTSVHQGTIFLSPFNNFVNGDSLKFSSDVSEGTILFFPSIIKHYTMPHNSSKERLILSFNLR